MSRLVAFGDSYTFGHGLRDCRTVDKPSQYAWPALLGKKLDLPVVNLGSAGASNLETLTLILSTKIEPSDIVIVGWSFVERDLIFQKSFFRKKYHPKYHTRVGNGQSSEEDLKAWLKVHNFYDLAIRSGLYIEHANLYLNSLGVKHYHFFTLPKTFTEIGCHKFPKWIATPKVELHRDLFPKLDVAEDGVHPGELSQQALADNLHRLINDK